MLEGLVKDIGIQNLKGLEIVTKLFQEVIPKYCKENVKDYPEKYGGMYMILKK